MNAKSKLLIFLFGLVICATAVFPVAGQQSAINSDDELRHGIGLYEAGDTEGALKVFKKVTKKQKDDPNGWYYLGLAYHSQDEIRLARSAFEQLIRLRPPTDKLADAEAKLAYAFILANDLPNATWRARRALELDNRRPEAHYAIAEANLRIGEYARAVQAADAALQLKSDFAPALITKTLAHYSLKQIAEAIATLEKLLATKPNNQRVWREQLEQLREREQIPLTPAGSGQSSLNTVTPGAATVRARVKEKPEPSYTEAARKAGVKGTVVLRAVFASDGQVKNVIILRALGYGLTEATIEVARKIKFNPAKKDGRPVSMWMQLEYNFNLY